MTDMQKSSGIAAKCAKITTTKYTKDNFFVCFVRFSSSSSFLFRVCIQNSRSKYAARAREENRLCFSASVWASACKYTAHSSLYIHTRTKEVHFIEMDFATAFCESSAYVRNGVGLFVVFFFFFFSFIL